MAKPRPDRPRCPATHRYVGEEFTGMRRACFYCGNANVLVNRDGRLRIHNVPEVTTIVYLRRVD